MTHAHLTQHQWHLLVDTVAEFCDATGGTREDLHDRAAGILDIANPPEWTPIVDDGPARELWCHIYEVLGALAHLADAAPHDIRHLHAVGRQVADLAHRMVTHREPTHV